MKGKRKPGGLKYAVLALVVDRPGYGYSLANRLASKVGHASQLNEGAVYVALRQLKSDGYVREIEREAVGSTQRSSRVVYAATPQGVSAAAEWFAAPLGAAEPVRSELVRQLALADQRHAPALLQGLEAAQLDCMDLIEETSRRRRAEPPPPGESEWRAEVRALVEEYNDIMLAAQLKWAQEAHSTLTRLEAERSAEGGG